MTMPRALANELANRSIMPTVLHAETPTQTARSKTNKVSCEVYPMGLR